MVFLLFHLCFLFCLKGKEGKTEVKKTISKVLGFAAVKRLLFISDFLILCYKEKINLMMCLHSMRRKH